MFQMGYYNLVYSFNYSDVMCCLKAHVGKYLISNYMFEGKPVSDSWNDSNNDGLWNAGEKGMMIYNGEIVSGTKH